MKKYCVKGLAACVVLLAATSGFAGVGDGLVSYWPFDGDLADAVGSNDGTFVGTDATVVYDAGAFGQGIDLDGVDQHVDVGNDASLDMSVGGAGAQTGSVSISAWFRVDAFDKSWQGLVAKGEGAAFRIARRDASNVLAYAGGSGDIPGDNIGPNVTRGLHHVLAISENAVSTRLWVDGMLVATGDAPAINNDGNGAVGANPPLLIGDNPQTDPNRSWNGLIDDVGIWNRALTVGEVQSIYNSGLAGISLGEIPEPSSLLLLGSGLGVLLGARRRR